MRENGEVRILLVDDEVAVQMVAGRMLSRFGYVPVKCLLGTEAVAAFRADPNGFDLVLLDMTLPDIPGAEVLSSIRAIRDDIPVVIMSGFTRGQIMDTLKDRIEGFIQKPIRLAVVKNLLAALLEPA